LTAGVDPQAAMARAETSMRVRMRIFECLFMVFSSVGNKNHSTILSRRPLAKMCALLKLIAKRDY
jgi:hypothetical protein